MTVKERYYMYQKYPYYLNKFEALIAAPKTWQYYGGLVSIILLIGWLV